MIAAGLHRQPVPLNRDKHGRTALPLPVADWSAVGAINAVFLAAAEFGHAASDYPIVFIKAGQDASGAADYAPIAVFGLAAGENLYLDGPRWRATYLPMVMALYPFCVSRLPDNRYAVCVDEGWAGFANDGAGQRLFGDDGEPTEFMRKMQGELERLEGQVDQTRALGRRLAALDLLRERRFDATLPDGRKLSADGFFVVDEDRVRALPDATVLELHREGVLAAIHAHWVSLGQMRRLVAWRAERAA